MTSSTSRTEAIKAYPILTYLALKMDDEELHNIELDINDGKLDLKESDTPYEGTPPQQMKRIQEIAIQLKILCSAISCMKANGDDLNYNDIAINLKSLRKTLLGRVDLLKKNPGVSVELDKIKSQLTKMQMPSLIQDYHIVRVLSKTPSLCPPSSLPPGIQDYHIVKVLSKPPSPHPPSSLPRGIQAYKKLPIFRLEKPDVPEEKIEVPTKESLTVEICESLQKREKAETVCSSSRATEMSQLTSKIFRRAVACNGMDYIQELYEIEEDDQMLKSNLLNLLFIMKGIGQE